MGLGQAREGPQGSAGWLAGCIGRAGRALGLPYLPDQVTRDRGAEADGELSTGHCGWVPHLSASLLVTQAAEGACPPALPAMHKVKTSSSSLCPNFFPPALEGPPSGNSSHHQVQTLAQHEYSSSCSQSSPICLVSDPPRHEPDLS